MPPAATAAPAATAGPAADISEADTAPVEISATDNSAKNRKKRAAQKAKKLATKAAPDEAVEDGSVEEPPPSILVFPPEVRGAVRVFEGERGRGLQCVRRVERGEVLIGIPRDWAISTDAASQSGGSSGQMALALRLVALKRKGDFRTAQLPDDNDMPCFWTAEELKFLEPSYVIEPASHQRRTLEQMYSQLSRAQTSKCTVDEFVWAMAMVQSRTFGGGKEMVLLPFIDLINTDTAPDLSFDIQSSKDGYIEVHASRAFEEGEEALVSYHGRNTPPELYSNFLAYGFVPTIGVTYPNVFPWTPHTDEGQLKILLQTCQEHIKALARAPVLTEKKDAPIDNADSASRRRAMARTLLTHEQNLSVGQAVKIKKRLAGLEWAEGEIKE